VDSPCCRRPRDTQNTLSNSHETQLDHAQIELVSTRIMKQQRGSGCGRKRNQGLTSRSRSTMQVVKHEMMQSVSL
jgi:hypothetical protein